ncbi:hypothetical protein DL96DRAFT_625111 [Flagelloscypha sp. PMI_526]|nr:hypothetical protein DL96DRAFT_625111 [Flagelloscypha sp. PMI_526]
MCRIVTVSLTSALVSCLCQRFRPRSRQEFRTSLHITKDLGIRWCKRSLGPLEHFQHPTRHDTVSSNFDQEWRLLQTAPVHRSRNCFETLQLISVQLACCD